MCNRVLGNSPKIPRRASASAKHHGRRTRRRTFQGSASHFFPHAGVLEKDAAFKTSDIFESKVLQWRRETFVSAISRKYGVLMRNHSRYRVTFTASRVALLSHHCSTVAVNTLRNISSSENARERWVERFNPADPTLLRAAP